MIPRFVLRACARVMVRHHLWVLLVATVLTAVAAWYAASLDLRTGFSATLSDDEPVVEGWNRLARDFPGAFVVQVTVETTAGREAMVAAAHQLEDGFRSEPELVRDVYLEQDLDFFARHSLLFVPTDELRVMESTVEARSHAFAALTDDPSLLGLLRGLAAISEDSFAASESVAMMSTRVFGRVLPEDRWLPGRPGVELGMAVDTDPLRDKIDAATIRLLSRVPLPPSEPRAVQTLDTGRSLLDLVADVLDKGTAPTAEDVARRIDALRESSLERLGLPKRYRISDDGTMLLMEVGSHLDLTVIENIEPFLAHIRGVIADVQLAHPDFTIGLSGYPPGYQEQTRAITNNFVLVTGLGFLGIVAVFVIGFQRVALPLLSVVPLLMGIVWSMAVQYLVVGYLNLLTLVFPVILLGLGIDFAIHLLSGYAARRHTGESPEVAFIHVFDRVGPGLFTGALTTSAAFFALTFASFKGFRDLGFIAGVGVLTAFVSMVTVLPALVALWERLRRRSQGRALLPDVPFPLLRPLARAIRANRYVVLTAFLILTIAAAYFVPRVGLQRDPQEMDPQGLPSAATQLRILDKFHQVGEQTVFFATDIDDARRIAEHARRAQTIGPVLSVTDALPEHQQANLPHLAALSDLVASVRPPDEAVAHTYDDVELAELETRLARIKMLLIDLSLLSATIYGDEADARVGELRDLVNRIDRRVVPASAERLRYLDGLIEGEVRRTWQDLADTTAAQEVWVEDLPRSIVERLRGLDGSWMVVTRAAAYPFQPEYLEAHMADIEAARAPYTGLIGVWYRMVTKITADLPMLIGLTVLAVAVLVLVDMRSVKRGILAMIPVAVGTVWTLGVLGALGLDFNVISLLALPLILGIGIDDGVHLVHRIHVEGDVEVALEHSGKAIILTSLTTAIGFGSLLLSVHGGLFRMGLTISIGIVVCLVVTLILVPALVFIFDEEAEEGSG